MTTLIPQFDLKNGGSTPTGAVNRAINLKLQEWVSVKDFGAVGDGTTNDTAAFNAAIAAQDGKALYIPQGNYLITAGLNTIANTINIFGSGKDSAKITFSPTTAGQTLFTIYKATGVLDRISMGGFAVYGTTANALTYLSIDNVSGGEFYDLEFNGGSNSATSSIGMNLKGREACSFTDISLFNMGQPIIVNAGVSGGIDHFNFSNLYITVSANPPLYPLFKVNAGAVTSNISFTGFQAWVGGLGAFDHAGTSGINMLFQSLRYETGGVVVANANIVPTFKFNPSSSITGITFSNGYISSIQPTTVTTKTTDFYFRNCAQINFNNTSISHADSGHIANWIDADNTCDEIFVANLLDTPGGHGYEILGSNLVDVCSTKGIETGPPTAPPNRMIVRKTAVGGINPFPAQLLGNAYFWSKVVSVANNGIISIAGFAPSLTQYMIAFSDNATPESIYGGGQFMVSGPNYAGTPNQQSVKLSGTSNIVNNSGATAGQVGVYKDTATPDVKVVNKTGVTITLSVIAMYSNI